MSSQRITVRVSESLVKRLKEHADMKGRSESVLVREALENYLGEARAPHSAYELFEAAGLIGRVRSAAPNLSTDRRHFEDFGKPQVFNRPR